MIPFLLAITGGYLIGSSYESKYRYGGDIYKDLSKAKPTIVNDKTNTKNVPEIDIIIKDKIKIPNAEKIQNSKEATDIFLSVWDKDKINVVEHMNVLLLNKSNMPIGYFEHSKGGIDGTIIDVEVISATSVKSLAKGVIIAHNHPSGNLQPSEADIKVSKDLKAGLALLKITLLDSLIVTPEGKYYSLFEEGQL